MSLPRPMIASEYLDYRARLDATLGTLAEAARRSGAQAGTPAMLRQLAASLRDPFLIVVAGESGAGKSVFLNALASEAICEPGRGEVAYYKFADQPRDVVGGVGLVERYRPCAFLRQFHVVELPGIGAAAEGAAAMAERFVPIADLVVAVISVTDAWTPGVWRSLDRVCLGLQKEVLVVLSGCDLRSVEEIRAVVEHMELTMLRRYGAGLPIFQMSGENAFLARTNPAAGGEAGLASSGILAFEEFVSRKWLASEARMVKFDNALRAARVVLDALQEPLGLTESILGDDSDLLVGLRDEINARYEQTNEKIRSDFFTRIDAGHAAAVAAAQAELAAASRWGTLPRQVLGGGRYVPRALDGFGERFRRQLVETTEGRVVEAMTTAETDVAQLWERLSARVAEGFEHQLSASDGAGKAVWSGRGESLLRRAEACTIKACADCSIEEATGEQRRQGAIALRFFAATALVLAIAASVLAWLALTPFDLLVGGLAIVALGFGAGQFIDARRKVHKALCERAEACRIQLRFDLSRELSSHVHEYYTKLGAIFDPVQALCREQVNEAAPQIAAVRGLEQEVAGLARELSELREVARVGGRQPGKA